MEVRPLLVCHLSRNRLMLNPWRSGYCDLNKGECHLNQSKEDSFVKWVAKNSNWNNGDRHKIHEIFLFNCFVFVIILVWQTVHSSAMTQITANLMEKTLQLTGNSPCFGWFSKETLWPLRCLENGFRQITKVISCYFRLIHCRTFIPWRFWTWNMK